MIGLVVASLLARLLAPAVVGLSEAGPIAPAAPTPRMEGAWAWPVVGPVIRDFDPPKSPYGSGHRGIDIAAALGTPVRVPEAGVVSFAGKVGGELFVTIDHGGGLQSTYSWLSRIAVRRGDVVARGATIGATGRGHATATVPHLHLGVRLGDAYLDPLRFLGPAPVSEVVHLAPDLSGS